MRKLAILALAALTLAIAGCVERKLTVISNPPGARLFLDGEEKGVTPVTFRYDFYGKREFLLRRDGYRTMREVLDVNAPLYDKPGIDFITELAPIPFSDSRTISFTMQPVRDVDRDELLNRANEMKYRLEGRPIPARARPSEGPPPSRVPPPPSTDNETVPPVPAPEAPAP